ncbi:MAG: ferrochelatase [Pseudomonadota bacterium]
MSSTKTGYLLINLGTPASAAVADVRRYLHEFLMDPYVLDAPWPIRKLIVSCFILPFRPKDSAHAYASIWRPEGSPLLLESQALCDALGANLQTPVALAMRYGEPGIAAAVTALRAQCVDEIVVVPLYPHYADSTVTTSVEAARAHLGDHPHRVLPVFFADPRYIEALAASVRAHLPKHWDHLLLSYHGLPERHLTKADPTQGHCLNSEDCCERPSPAQSTCYRHQVMTTSRLLTAALEIEPERYSVSFQSRLGRLPWLQPYTDQRLEELAAQGVRDLVVACPAFVADNLETLEEMGIAGRKTFLDAGGASFTLVPCLNAQPDWIEAFAQILDADRARTDLAVEAAD